MAGDFVFAGEQQVPILGYGEIDIKVNGPRGPRLLRLYDVAYCENFACNLVSLRILRRQGYWWDNRQKQTYLRRADDSMVCRLFDKHDQFVLEHIPIDMTRASFFTRRNQFNTWSERKAKSGDSERWHLRLGHPGPQALEHLVNSSEGVKIIGPTMVECDACGVSKMKRQIRRRRRQIDEEPGLRFAIDFHPLEKGMEGYKHLMLVTDRWSGYIWDYYLEELTAESIIRALQSLLGIFENQFLVKPKVWECDNEIPSVKPEIGAFLRAQHMRLEPSAPYTQAQNGAAERSGGVIKDKARAMRASAKLPQFLWPEIYRTAVYLYNRTPKYIYNWKTPYDRFHAYVAQSNGMSVRERKPQQAHLRVYGCKAFTLTKEALQKTNRLQRLKPRAWIGYLVGYNSTNVYRIWNPLTNKVIVARDVAFNEDQRFSGDLDDLKDELLKVSTEEYEEPSRPSDPKVRVIRKQLYCHAIKKEKKRSLEWWR